MSPNFESCGRIFLTETVNDTILKGMQGNPTNLVGQIVAAGWRRVRKPFAADLDNGSPKIRSVNCAKAFLL
ncbi:hypothetical protein [Ruegeria sp. MALMAid1280]|uniref:hypothetical protein n=1 Tax=Ruegeria sp. MALMAid1280 TaxID=3411634 RepID=UPI003BA1ADCD